MSLKGVFSLFQLGTRHALKRIPNELNSQKMLYKYIHKTGIKASVTEAKRDLQQISITKTIPTRHQSLKIAFDDNLACDFQYIWLRDNCNCEKCIHPVNKQKLLDTVNLDINIKPKSYHIAEGNGKLKVVWLENNGSEHISFYDSEWLHKYGKGFELDSHDSVHDNLPPMINWSGKQLKDINPEFTYKEVMETKEGLEAWLETMYKYGLVIVRDAPNQKGEVIKFIERVSYLKQTKWGSSFDVICEPLQTDPNHLAYTGIELEHHTDMNYLEKSPGIQALHCLKSNPSGEADSAGGQSFFVDGFYIGKWLQNEHPSSFHSLTSTLVEFKIYSHNMEYSSRQYVLCATKTGTMQEVHYNTRTMAPIKGPADMVQPFYEAYKLMGQKMREEESMFSINLVPGDIVVFNNRRILHGRTSFDPKKMCRHLEGCYGDIDEIITQYRSLYKAEKK